MKTASHLRKALARLPVSSAVFASAERCAAIPALRSAVSFCAVVRQAWTLPDTPAGSSTGASLEFWSVAKRLLRSQA